MARAENSRGSAGLADRSEVASGIALLEAWIESQMAYRGVPGLSLGIVCDQELIWSRGFGHADLATKRPAAPDTIYRVASISKLFTSVAIMQLRDAGKLGLDDPLERHVPGFRLRGEAQAEPVTLRHILTHTAGLPREAAYPYWTDFDFPTRERIEAALPEQDAIYPPETKWKYSNLGMALAGAVVENVSGEPYAHYVRRHIFEPLGMASTSVEVPEERRHRLATGYGRRLPDGTRATQPYSETRGIAPAAGLASTVEDLARFVSLQFRDGAAGERRILDARTLREMHRVHWLRPDWMGGWGLGFAVTHRGERDLVGHGGWLAGYQSHFSFSPKEKIGVVAMFNADDAFPYVGHPQSVVDRVYQWVAPAIVEATRPKPEPAKPRAEWKKYLGTYRSSWRDIRVLILNGNLMVIAPTEPDPTPTQLTLVPTGKHTFRTRSDAPFIEDGDPVVFEMDRRGRVARLKVAANYYDPVREDG